MCKLYLYSPSTGLYACPLAMTDGAAKVIQVCVCLFVCVSLSELTLMVITAHVGIDDLLICVTHTNTKPLQLVIF